MLLLQPRDYEFIHKQHALNLPKPVSKHRNLLGTGDAAACREPQRVEAVGHPTLGFGTAFGAGWCRRNVGFNLERGLEIWSVVADS